MKSTVVLWSYNKVVFTEGPRKHRCPDPSLEGPGRSDRESSGAAQPGLQVTLHGQGISF